MALGSWIAQLYRIQFWIFGLKKCETLRIHSQNTDFSKIYFFVIFY